MKDLIVDANFPRTIDQRVYHLGIRAGEVANRIVTVGSPSRAHGIAGYLDRTPKPFVLHSERGFTTISGRYNGIPVSIMSIGMGYPNADFFVREVRECLRGDMVVVRLGSCGALIDVPVGTVVVPRTSIAVSRNYDFDFQTGQSEEPAYRISKPVDADLELRLAVRDALVRLRPATLKGSVVDQYINASADSFYSSQGRQTSFPDHNDGLISHLRERHPDLATLEMETFHILHLAANWPASTHRPQIVRPPVSTLPVQPAVSTSPPPSSQDQPENISESSLGGALLEPRPRIRAAAAQMVFASRTSQDFITPEQVVDVEAWTGRAVLEALTSFKIEPERLHGEAGSVWEIQHSKMI
ncbi:purine and uridine phosphorylase [Wolfiporia cocos MD-104 SS10]|uniref:Purine and uridine phosphorylase n=1 Tax=Wolfiporia cocos (strain MD-104) TaxID=742152 RepID=A0A2H3IZL2_WOLCO|nr:purine and uridine phosphorylase [Wolfiporia cocos MD-104 SS10]